MRRFFVDSQSLNPEALMTLDGDEFHHLKNVCRLEEGERVELLDGKGKIAVAVIRAMSKKSADLEIESVTQAPPPPRPAIHIILGVPRFQKMDMIIQKSVELGVASLTPVVSERSFMKTLSRDLTHKIGRWNKISGEACKQSGRAWPLVLHEAATLDEKIAAAPPEASLFLYEGESSLDIKTALEKWKVAPDSLTVFIGAEGGFSPQEVAKFKAAGLLPVTMGPLVLRVETACIALSAVIEYHFGGMR